MIAPVARLCKIRVSALAAATAATGHILASDGVSQAAVAPTLCLFLAACGASALNQVQEIRTDSAMSRTRGRPIPSGQMSAGRATALSAASLAGGLLGLLLCANLTAALLAAAAVIWYNGAYTYLKRVTVFAAVPGGLVGAIPPAVGWTAAGGTAFSPEIVALMVFMFIWQVPHFWLLLLRHSVDYDRAGLPAVTKVFSPEQLGRIIFVWILAAAVCPMIIPVAGGGAYLILPVVLGPTAIWLLPHAARHLGRKRGLEAAGAVYVRLNLYAILVLSSLSAGAILDGKI
jgi:protoheme IX farnesyltransferase